MESLPETVASEKGNRETDPAEKNKPVQVVIGPPKTSKLYRFLEKLKAIGEEAAEKGEGLEWNLPGIEEYAVLAGGNTKECMTAFWIRVEAELRLKLVQRFEICARKYGFEKRGLESTPLRKWVFMQMKWAFPPLNPKKRGRPRKDQPRSIDSRAEQGLGQGPANTKTQIRETAKPLNSPLPVAGNSGGAGQAGGEGVVAAAELGEESTLPSLPGEDEDRPDVLADAAWVYKNLEHDEKKIQRVAQGGRLMMWRWAKANQSQFLEKFVTKFLPTKDEKEKGTEGARDLRKLERLIETAMAGVGSPLGSQDWQDGASVLQQAGLVNVAEKLRAIARSMA